MAVLKFDEIQIEEMPSGAFISSINGSGYVKISSERDAIAVIESLSRMLEVLMTSQDCHKEEG